jgi:putative ABC transport system permease protein
MTFQLSLALKYLATRKLRTALTTLAIVIGVMLTFGMPGLMPAVVDSFRQTMMAAANQVDVTITSQSRTTFEADVLDTVQETPGVAYVTGSLVRSIFLPAEYAPVTDMGMPVTTVMINGLDPVAAPVVRPLTLSQGRLLEAEDDSAILIADTLANKTGLGVGDTLTLPSSEGITEFEIAGIVTGSASVGVDQAYITLAAAQSLLNMPGQINTIEALFTPGSDVEATRQDVIDRLGEGYKIGGIEAGSEIMQFVDMAEGVFAGIGVLALAMGGFIIFNTFRTGVAERRRDVGMLRSVGASRRTITGLVLTESLLQGVIGTALGLLAGYLFVTWLVAAINPIWEQQFHFSLGKPAFKLWHYALAIGLGVGVTVLGGLLPARSASRVSPLDALRPSPGEVAGKVMSRSVYIGIGLIALAVLGLVSGNFGLSSLGMLLFLAGLVMVAPALVYPIARVFGRALVAIFAREGHLAQGNLIRQPGRAAVTMSAMMIGLAIVLSVAGLISSLSAAIWTIVDRTLGADYLLMPQSQALATGNVGSGPELLEQVRAIDGIRDVSTLRVSAGRINEMDVTIIGIDPVTYPQVSSLEFEAGEPEQAYDALGSGRAAIVNTVLATQDRLEIGDEIMIHTPEGVQAYTVAAIGVEFTNIRTGAAYISHHNLERDLHVESDTLIMVGLARGADAAQVRTSLEALIEDYPAFDLFDKQEYVTTLKETANAKLVSTVVMLVMLAVPSLLALINTLAINVIERTREIGMLRAVGATRRQVRRLILSESLLLSAAGTAFGILAGLWLGYIFVQGMNVYGVVTPYFFPAWGILLTIAVGLIFGVLAALVPARQAARLDIIAALQYE